MSGWSPSTSAEDPSGGALFIMLMLLVLDVTVDQCAHGGVTAEMQKQRDARDETREGREGRLFVFGTHCAALLGSQQSSGWPGHGKTGFSPDVCTTVQVQNMYICHA